MTIRYDKKLLRQLWRFAIAGLANTAIGLTIIFVLVYIGIGALVANLIGYCLGFTITFIVSKKWTFDSKQPAKATAPLFVFSAVTSYVLNLITILILQQMTELGPYLVHVGGVAVYAIAMFLFCRALVFK